MATIEQRLQVLENRVNTTDQSLNVFICKGDKTTTEEQEKIAEMGDGNVIVVLFVKPENAIPA